VVFEVRVGRAVGDWVGAVVLAAGGDVAVTVGIAGDGVAGMQAPKQKTIRNR
jgi:hypothetical protein